MLGAHDRNERDWLTGIAPAPMLGHLGDRGSERKLRLFAVACCRRIFGRLSAERSRDDLRAAERLADGLLAEVEHQRHLKLSRVQIIWLEEDPGAVAAYLSLHPDIRPASLWVAYKAARAVPEEQQAAEAETQADLLRDVFGNPYRPVMIDPAWAQAHDGAVRRVAQGIYAEQAFAQMPILADALEDAGCTDAAILDHCRQPGTHVRGCWLLDLLLGKE